MTLSPMAETALRTEVSAFLDHARALSARGEVDAALELYDFPIFLVRDEDSEMIADRAGLLRHLDALAQLRRSDGTTIWYQEVRKVSVLTRKLVCVTADVQRLDARGKPMEGVQQTLILRRSADGFRFSAIINPIGRGYWTDDPGAFR